MENDKLLGLLWAPFLADAYSLGGHWIYETNEINTNTLDFSTLNNPLSTYHPTKKAGDFTHYGDQALWLLMHLKEHKTYDAINFGKLWQSKMTPYTGYKDKASTQTLTHLKEGKSFLACGSNSTELSIIGRHAPLIYTLHDNIDEINDAIKLHTVLTHMSKEALESSKFITEVVMGLLYNQPLEMLIQGNAAFYGDTVKNEVELALKFVDEAPIETVEKLGASCNLKGALASTIFLVLKYQNSFEEFLEANVQAGGDSAARGMVGGMLLGAKLGFKEIKPTWITKLSAYNTIESLL
ncbi:MAG: ADP-ribosylglycohydrolase family protein [Epsilonproteobacteria bacterium]|nr:ADP-ribosylglycohydrolase family protein [Campylobacterota bacterium]